MPKHAKKPTPLKRMGSLLKRLLLALCICACLAAAAIGAAFAWRAPQSPSFTAISPTPAVTHGAETALASQKLVAHELKRRYASLAELLSEEEVSTLTVIGDSITAGFLIDGYDDKSDTGVVIFNRADEEIYYETPTTVDCWTNRFRRYAARHGVRTFVNAGISGFRFAHLALMPDAWLPAKPVDVIVVMLGSNDVAFDEPDLFAAHAEEALLYAQEACAHLVVVSPPNNARTDATNLTSMKEADEILTKLCEKHHWEQVSLVDVLEVKSSDFYDDQLHPTASGSKKLWHAFRDRLDLPRD